MSFQMNISLDTACSLYKHGDLGEGFFWFFLPASYLISNLLKSMVL